jgi:hypothetical protein
MADNFEYLENSCRQEFFNLTQTAITTIYDVVFEQNKWSRTDCIFNSGFTEYVAELKQRKYSHLKTWGHQVGFVYEFIKHQALMQSKVLNKLFIIIFLDAVVIWNVGEMNLEWKDELLSATHQSKENKKIKKVTYLQLSQASHIYLK